MEMASPGIRTVTVAVQAGWCRPGQVLPGAAEPTVVVRTLTPVSGLLTVTEYVMVAVAPIARSPVQVSVDRRADRAGRGPRVVVVRGVVQHPGQRVVTVAPV